MNTFNLVERTTIAGDLARQNFTTKNQDPMYVLFNKVYPYRGQASAHQAMLPEYVKEKARLEKTNTHKERIDTLTRRINRYK